MTDGVGGADEPWTLTPSNHALVMSKRGETRLGFAILLSFFRDRGRFPRQKSEVDPQGIATLSRQLSVPTPVDGEAFLAGLTAERIRSEIRVRFGFREATVADADALTQWLRDHVAADAGGEIDAMVARLEGRCRELAMKPPTTDRIQRIARAALRAHEELRLLTIFDVSIFTLFEVLFRFQFPQAIARSRFAAGTSLALPARSAA
jgi:hypothetical protein